METLLYILKSAGVLSLFYLIYILLLKKETLFNLNRHFLLFGILAAIIFPFLEFTKTVLMEVPAFEPSQISEIVADPIAQESSPFFSFERILVLIYAIGFLALLVRFFYQLFILMLLLKKYPAQKINGYKFIKVSEAISPFSFFNYLVYNPIMHPDGELEMILKHEKVHINQHHSLDILISNLLIILQWFNPMAWGYKKSIEENLEFIADHNTAKQVYSTKEYQLVLVKASSATILPALTNYFYKSFIKKRIIMLNKTNSNKRNALKATLVLPLLAIFLWSFNVKEETRYVEVSSKNDTTETNTTKEQPTEIISTEKKKGTKNVSSKEIAASPKKSEKVEKTKTSPIDKFRVKIDKNTTDAQFKEIKENLKTNYGIDFNYAVTRNNNNEIISISISYSDNGNNGNYQITQGSAIDEFFFFINDDGKAGFWSEAAEARHKEHMEKRKMMMNDRDNEMAGYKEEMKRRLEERKLDVEERRMAMQERKQAMKARMEDMKTRMYDSSNAGKTTERIYQNDYAVHTSTDTEQPLYYVDGKETSKQALKLLSPDNIEKINVLKGKKALKKYGGKGVNGVVEIITKK